jgi:fibronectin-binding autotransporter adhesin
MATRTISAAGGTRAWSDLLSWTEAAVPTAADDVVATALSGNLTIDGTSGSPSLCRSADFTGYVGTLTQGSGATLNIGDASGGSLIIVAGMTYSPNTGGVINFVSTTTGNTITPAGKTLPQLVFNGSGGAWSISAALSCRSIITTVGTVTATSTIATSSTMAINGGTLNLGGNVTLASSLTVAGGALSGAAYTLSCSSGSYSSGSANLLGLTMTNTATISGAAITLGASGGTIAAIACSAGSLTTSGPLVMTTSVSVTSTGSLDATGQSISGGSQLTMSSSGTLSFASFSGSAAISITAGTTTVTGNVSSGTSITFSGSTARTINMGSGTWTAGGTGTVWNNNTVTNQTLNPGSSTIAITNPSASTKQLNCGGKTYNNLTISQSAGAVTINGNNTWNVMTLNQDANVQFTSANTRDKRPSGYDSLLHSRFRRHSFRSFGHRILRLPKPTG